MAQPLISLSGSSRTPPEHPQMASLDWPTHTEDLVLLLQKVPCLSLRSGHRIWGIFMKNKKHLHHKRSENIKQHEWFISDIMAGPILLQFCVYMIYSYIFYIFFRVWRLLRAYQCNLHMIVRERVLKKMLFVV